MKRRKLARLNAAEEKFWQTAFAYHQEVGKQGQERAAARAWRDLQRDFPRLRKYQGCLP